MKRVGKEKGWARAFAGAGTRKIHRRGEGRDPAALNPNVMIHLPLDDPRVGSDGASVAC
jgi:hypothetical protein